MQGLVFWLSYPFLWLISILPFPIFYMVSDVVFAVVFHLVRYRRKIVKDNLNLVFPEKSATEIKKIEKKFYRHMVDMFLEMVKSISISEEELKKRFSFTNIEVVKDLEKKNKGILLACGHYASYEWMNALQLHDLSYKGFGVYKKIKNRYFDRLAKRIRGRYDGVLIPTREATHTITENQKNGVLGAYAMVSDQSPRIARAKAWTDFMGVQVPIFFGLENLSRKLDMAVVYLHVEKLRRGFYQATFKTISLNPAQEENFFISRRFFDELEEQIKTAPEFYLWTHKRWKHRNVPIPEGSELF